MTSWPCEIGRTCTTPVNTIQWETFVNWWEKIFVEKTFVYCSLVPSKDATPPNFAKKTFANSQKTSKFVKIFFFKSFPFYRLCLIRVWKLTDRVKPCVLICNNQRRSCVSSPGTWWALVLHFSWRPSQFSFQLQVGKSASSTDSVVMSRTQYLFNQTLLQLGKCTGWYQSPYLVRIQEVATSLRRRVSQYPENEDERSVYFVNSLQTA